MSLSRQVACQIDGLRGGLSGEEHGVLEAIKLTCHLNFAQCCIKQKEYFEAIKRLSEKVLKHHPDNAKALYRCAALKMKLVHYLYVNIITRICSI
jgi:hypothetical protein